ncbi:MAG: hypothetical protein LBS91_03810 [Clostridiales Family XIII bacterium]|nr:hypothetical protein [Clostridiales Family XIII bacterium]
MGKTIRQSTMRRRIFAIVLAILMAFAMGAALNTAQAYAATDDEWLISYDDITYGQNQYVYVLDYDQDAQDIYLGPSTDGETPTWFDRYEDAIDWMSYEVIDSDGIDGNLVEVYWDADERDEVAGHWESVAYVYLPEDGSYGTISIKAIKTNPDDTTDYTFTSITIIRNQEDAPAPDKVDDVDVWIYDPADNTGMTVYKSDPQAILSNTYYEDPPRTFPTAMDATYESWYNQYIPFLTNITVSTPPPTPWIGTRIVEMTVHSVEWALEDNGDGTYDSWLYAVYRDPDQTGTYTRIDIAEYIGADSYRDFAGDVIVWKYGWNLSTNPVVFAGQYDNIFGSTL